MLFYASVLLIAMVILSKTKQVYSQSFTSNCNAAKIEPEATCPSSRSEWNRRAKQKQCTEVVLPCKKKNALKYHCLINTWKNLTLSVCAVPTYIIGYYCPEFNIKGSSIQPHYDTNCSINIPACPFRYNSQDVYKYQSCYVLNIENSAILNHKPTTKSEMETSDSDSFFGINSRLLWCILVLVIIPVAFAVSFTLYKKHCDHSQVQETTIKNDYRTTTDVLSEKSTLFSEKENNRIEIKMHCKDTFQERDARFQSHFV